MNATTITQDDARDLEQIRANAGCHVMGWADDVNAAFERLVRRHGHASAVILVMQYGAAQTVVIEI